jgi:predicted tellurium resistance membrane protein TerC
VLLSGDNAVVIAMAARGLPARQQKKAIVFGSGAAIVMRIVLTLIAVKMLGLPWLKLAGGLALLWIGANLMSEEEISTTARPSRSASARPCARSCWPTS